MPTSSDALHQPDALAAKQRLARCVSAGLLALVIAALALVSPTPAWAGPAAAGPATAVGL